MDNYQLMQTGPEIQEILDSVGDLDDLTTTDKDSVVDAVNEVDSHTDVNTAAIGTLASLNTTDKSNLVAAVNEINTAKWPKIDLTNPLWENADPSQSFGEFTADSPITVTGASNYSLLLAQVACSTSLTTTFVYEFIINGTQSAFSYSAPSYTYRRLIKIDGNNMIVTHGTRVASGGGSENDGFLIPYRIYGLF